MRRKKYFIITAIAAAAALSLTACGFKEEEQVVVEATPTPTPEATPTPEPTPTPTITPDAQTTVYTAQDQSMSIQLPDATWASHTDEADMQSFESPEVGSILILHGSGDDLATAVIPDTQDTAVALEQAAELVEGTDFEIQNYSASDVNGVGVYSYVVKMLNAETREYAYMVNKWLANDQEYYSITGTVKNDDAAALSAIQDSIATFTILNDSTLKPAAAGTGTGTAQGTDGTGEAAGTTEGTSAGTAQGIVPSADNPDNTDTSKTRTIYRNSDGHPLVVSADANGNWVDEYGNTYDFVNECDVYDQDGVDYYYHGEAADVYYMPVDGGAEEEYSEDYEEDYSEDYEEDYSDDGSEEYSDDGSEDYEDDGSDEDYSEE